MVRTKQQKQVKNATTETPIHPAKDVQKQVKFRYRTDPGANVYIVGSFNDWNPLQTRLRDESGDGRYRVSLALAPGRYEYKFVVNGQWRIDPKCPDPIVNRYNTLNGVVTVN
ncbi:MAG: glycogen-binding domain-containing protein [Verrucomicrobiota bacterium]